MNLSDVIFWALVLVPAWGLPFGVFGAALGAKLRGTGAVKARQARVIQL